jgi:serine/threonine protein kinase
MYDKGIIHRDINLSNILLKINNNLNKITFKLSGYGSNKILSQENESEYTLTDFNKDKFDELKSYRSEGVIKRQMKKKIMIVFKNN